MLLLVTAGSLQAQTLEERVSALEARMDAIESRVARLETFHPNREFTITQGNFTLDEFNSYITNLDVKDGEWLYVKSSGDIDGDGQTDILELCTSDQRFTSLFGYYLNGNPDDPFGRQYYFNGNSDNDLTYNKNNFTQSNFVTDWRIATHILVNSLQNERLRMKADGPGGSSEADIFSRSGLIHFYTSGPDFKVTYRAGTTRMEACGF